MRKNNNFDSIAIQKSNVGGAFLKISFYFFPKSLNENMTPIHTGSNITHSTNRYKIERFKLNLIDSSISTRVKTTAIINQMKNNL
jgi:hypothetical protein